MHAVKFFACLDLEQKYSFLDRHVLAFFKTDNIFIAMIGVVSFASIHVSFAPPFGPGRRGAVVHHLAWYSSRRRFSGLYR